MMNKTAIITLAASLLLGCSQANSQEEKNQGAQAATTAQTTTPPKSCQEPEFRQLDFWVGEWDLEWDVAEGKLATGTNIITKSAFGDCVITENFDGGAALNFKGMSVSTYHKPMKLWRQTWVDDQGGYFALSGGPHDDGTFALVNTRLGDKGPYLRMMWKGITKDSLTWHWQGKKTQDEDWQDRWVIRYTRKK